MKTFFSILLLSTVLSITAIEAETLQTKEVINPKYDASLLVRMSLNNIQKNYPEEDNRMSVFYKESVSKNNTIYSCNEAILDVCKASYLKCTCDKIVLKNARSNNLCQEVTDGFQLKLQGGPSAALKVDFVKNPFFGLQTSEILEKFSFSYSIPEVIDNKTYYVVDFNDVDYSDDLYYKGKLYIDPETYAIGRVVFSMNVDKQKYAQLQFLVSKPSSVKMDVKAANYIVNYKRYQDKWYLDYCVSEVKLAIQNNRKSPCNDYTIRSRMAVTDFEAGKLIVDKKNLLKESDILADKVKEYDNGTNWEIYNKIMYLTMGNI